MIMCVLLCYPVSIHMSQLLSTGRPISSCAFVFGLCHFDILLDDFALQSKPFATFSLNSVERWTREMIY